MNTAMNQTISHAVNPAALNTSPFTLAEVEAFLYHEAALLDDWQLREWLALYTRDASYSVLSPDLPVDASPDEKLFLIADGYVRLEQRVIRLGKKTAHAEWPNSRTLHQVTNVQLLSSAGDTAKVRSAFSVFRTKDSVTTHFIGYAYHTLLRTPDGLRIREKRCAFALDNLRGQGKLAILL